MAHESNLAKGKDENDRASDSSNMSPVWYGSHASPHKYFLLSSCHAGFAYFTQAGH